MMNRIFRAAFRATCCLVLVLAGTQAGAADESQKGAPSPASSKTTASAFGTFARPFAADSLWNSRPVRPVLGDFVIQKSDYYPAVAEGAWSTGVFLAKASDPPMRVWGLAGKTVVWDPDAEQDREIVVPRWPPDLVPASEADGHADIVDPVEGVVHSLWQLKKVDGKWTAAQYAWTALDGRGWGDPAHYQQGSRAAGVPTAAGLIRKHEIDDGERLYHHALAVSLPQQSLSADPVYVFPATSADTDAARVNTGKIPEGALLMLPASYDTQAITTPALRKVAETLKVYGARVVDRNTGTPFNIYVELGSGFNLHKGGWSNQAAGELDTIRAALRQVVSTDGWIDGNGKSFTPNVDLNLLSMRGPWKLQSGSGIGVFETRRQAVVFSQPTGPVVQQNDSGNGLNPIAWALPTAGKVYRLKSIATGGAKVRVVFHEKTGGRIVFDSGELADGESKSFPWPADASFTVFAISGPGPSSIGATLSTAR